MIDNDLQKLIARDGATDLGRLEADIWHREAGVRAGDGASRRLASWQGSVIALAVIGSAGIGVSTGMAAAYHNRATPLTPVESLAPSSLLFGAVR
jgi:hypothetical protein